jgi:hypothetical protein
VTLDGVPLGYTLSGASGCGGAFGKTCEKLGTLAWVRAGLGEGTHTVEVRNVAGVNNSFFGAFGSGRHGLPPWSRLFIASLQVLSAFDEFTDSLMRRYVHTPLLLPFPDLDYITYLTPSAYFDPAALAASTSASSSSAAPSGTASSSAAAAASSSGASAGTPGSAAFARASLHEPTGGMLALGALGLWAIRAAGWI